MSKSLHTIIVTVLLGGLLYSPDTHAQERPDETSPNASKKQEPKDTKKKGWLTVRQQNKAGEDKGTQAEPDGHTPGFDFLWWYRSSERPAFDSANPQDPLRSFNQRLRGRYKLRYGNFEFDTEMDFFSGRLLGSQEESTPKDTHTGTRPHNGVIDSLQSAIDPRSLHVGVMTPVGLIRAGLQTSSWGLGLLANDGTDDDARLFGQSYGGDRALRLAFATKPFAPFASHPIISELVLATGADVVFRDDIGSLLDGDLAIQGLVSLFYRDEPTFAGVYAALRSQTDRDGDVLNILALDAAASDVWSLGDGDWELGAGFEAVALIGSTNRAIPRNADADQPMGVRGNALAGEFSLLHQPSSLGFKFLSGYASGDANADDDTIYRMRFDPNYKVGLVLFERFIPAITRQFYKRASDPEQSAEAPKGAEGLIAEGAVENAVYLNPQILFGRENGLLAGIGALFAWSAVPLQDPYNTFASGGTPTGVFGASPVGSFLGTELDIAIRYRVLFASELTLEFKGEYGILLPGDAFLDQAGQEAIPQNLARVRAALTW